jgi:hypothetical protein
MQLSARCRVFMSAHPVLTGIAVLIGVVWLVGDSKKFLLLASLVVVATGLGMLGIDSWRHRRHEKAELAVPAEGVLEQHASANSRGANIELLPQ